MSDDARLREILRAAADVVAQAADFYYDEGERDRLLADIKDEAYERFGDVL